MRIHMIFVSIGAVVLLSALALGTGYWQSGADRDAGRLDAASTNTVTVMADEYLYEPEAIRVEPGSPVELVVENRGGVAHDLEITLPATDVETDGQVTVEPADAGGTTINLYIAAGETAKVRFVPTEEGSYGFICTLPGHEIAGMTGELVVSAD